MQKYNKAGAAAIGAAISVIAGHYLGWDTELQAALAVVVSGILTWAIPNKI